MERELSSTMAITVSLIAVTALLSIVFLTLSIGGTVQEGASRSLTDVSHNLSMGYIEDLYLGVVDREMPMATAYNILRTYEDVILESACYNGEVTNLLTQGPCTGSNIRGKVQLELFKVNGGYVAFVHTDKFTWNRAEELAKTPSEREVWYGYEALRKKYGLTFDWKWW